MRRQCCSGTHCTGRVSICCGRGRSCLQTPGLARKVKPLCRFYEREMAAYALLRGIEYIYEECPFAEGSTSIYYKEVLNRLENDRPGSKLTFYLRFLEARANGLFAEQERRQELHACPNCGQPTSAPGSR